MERQQDNHHLRHHMVDSPQQPAAGHLMLDVVDALPGGLGAGRIAGPQNQSRDHLRHEGKHQRAPPHIAPAGPARHAFVEGFMHKGPVAGAIVEKIGQLAQHARLAGAG